jgi:hypothetical protein
MKISVAALLATAAVATQSAHGWTLTYRNSRGVASVASGTGNRACGSINHARGQIFAWDRAVFSRCCVKLYSAASCRGNPQGYSCPDWSKPASVPLRSYRVESC